MSQFSLNPQLDSKGRYLSKKKKNFLRMSRPATLIFLMGLFQLTSTLDSNQLLFTVIGETTRESGYAHLVIPLPVPELGNTVDVLNDLINSFMKYTMKPNNLYKKTESYGIDRIQAKIGLILSLARQGGFVAKELHYDDVNLIMDGLGVLDLDASGRLLPQ